VNLNFAIASGRASGAQDASGRPSACLFFCPVNNTVLYLILQESSITIERSREQTQRCLTLEVAIDTILFCSSIARDIAYRVATIGLEHEQKSELASALCPAVSMVGQSIPKSDGSLKPPPPPPPPPPPNKHKTVLALSQKEANDAKYF